MLPLRPTNKPYLIPIKDLLKRKEENVSAKVTYKKSAEVDFNLNPILQNYESVLSRKTKYKVLPPKNNFVSENENFIDDKEYNLSIFNSNTTSDNKNTFELNLLEGKRIDLPCSNDEQIIENKYEIDNEDVKKLSAFNLQLDDIGSEVILNNRINVSVKPKMELCKTSFEEAYHFEQDNMDYNFQTNNLNGKIVMHTINNYAGKKEIINEKQNYITHKKKISKKCFNNDFNNCEELKDYLKDNIEDENINDIVDKIFLRIKNYIDRNIEEKYCSFIDFKKYLNTEHVNGESLDHHFSSCKNELQHYFEERLKSLDVRLDNHMRYIETKINEKIEKLNSTKLLLSNEMREIFQVYARKFNNEDNLRTYIQKELHNLLFFEPSNSITNENSIKYFVEQIITEILVKKENKFSNFQMHSVASQTEDSNKQLSKIEENYAKIENILNLINNTCQLMHQNLKRMKKNNETFNASDVINVCHTAMNNNSKINTYFLPFQTNFKNETHFFQSNILNNIDAELEHYKQKYIHNSKLFIQESKRSSLKSTEYTL